MLTRSYRFFSGSDTQRVSSLILGGNLGHWLSNLDLSKVMVVVVVSPESPLDLGMGCGMLTLSNLDSVVAMLGRESYKFSHDHPISPQKDLCCFLPAPDFN